MRYFIIIALFLSFSVQAQDDYYSPPVESAAPAEHKPHCYCPYQKSTTVWDDIWNDGILGTSKAVYQSTVKPQVLGKAMGAVQGAANKSPLPTIAAETAVALGTSEVHKARRHKRNKQIPRAGQTCNCDPCPYHGQRYHSATGTN